MFEKVILFLLSDNFLVRLNVSFIYLVVSHKLFFIVYYFIKYNLKKDLNGKSWFVGCGIFDGNILLWISLNYLSWNIVF